MINIIINTHKLLKAVAPFANVHEDISSISERQELWERIRADLYRRQFKTKRRKLFVFVSSVAAVLAILILSLQRDNLFQSESDLSRIALDFKVNMDSINEVQLMVSADNTILVEGGSLVSYSNTGSVGVNKEIIDSKSDVVGAEEEYNKLVVPKGKRVSLILSDGSKLDVNAGTKVIYPRVFKKNRREIFVDGEIFIDVTPNQKVPFIVSTSTFDVKVLGTSFNIRSYSDEQNDVAEVVLVQGKVEIEDNHGEEVAMNPNQLVTLSGRGMEKFTNVDVTIYTAWRDGIINLDGLSLEKVFHRLVRFYGVKIQGDPLIGESMICGKLDLDDNINEVFRRLSLIVSFTYEYNANTGIYYIKMID